jgi:hypothetical protein
MFCGWRLANSFRSLASLGSGILQIDALRGSCQFRGEPIGELSIAGELRCWLREDLAASGIPPEKLSHASLTAQLTLSAVAAKQRVTNVCYLRPDGQVVRSGSFYRCAIDCEAEIATDEAIHRSHHHNVTEWPQDWP